MSSITGDRKFSPEGKNRTRVSSTEIDQLNQGLGDITLDSNQGSWDVSLKKNKNGAQSGAGWGFQRTTGGGGRGWVKDVSGWVGGGNAGNQPMNDVPPPLQGGWNWKSRLEDAEPPVNVLSGSEDVDDAIDDSEDELVSDDYDSDESETGHDLRKKNRWFASFFGTLDDLTVEQINEPVRQWHCAACQNGPGSIHWFVGIRTLLTHVKTKGSKRVKIHQDFAQILEEELSQRGAMVVPTGEVYGQWKGLDEALKDHEIVWPPMLIIMNTQLDVDENEKWVGMGNSELLDYFNSYNPVKGRHSFGPKGHRGMSVLIFETSAVGYLEAERVCKHFERQGADRDAWEHRRNLYHPGGKRQLYGFMATKSDLDIFNQHSSEKVKVKFELVSYEEKVANQLIQMKEDNEQLVWYKSKIAKQERDSKALEEAVTLLSQKLRKLEEENQTVRQRTQMYHEQNKEEMDFQEQFFKEQLKVIQDAKEASLKKEEHKRVEKSCAVAER